MTMCVKDQEQQEALVSSEQSKEVIQVIQDSEPVWCLTFHCVSSLNNNLDGFGKR